MISYLQSAAMGCLYDGGAATATHYQRVHEEEDIRP
jgi:hypothetical protein